MTRNRDPHLAAVLQALLVTFLWSTSWVLIKLGLKEIPALTFAGLRYILAFAVLAPYVLARSDLRGALRDLSTRDWLRLTLLGLIFYTVTQGAQFVGLEVLPAVTVSLILSFSPAVVALASMPLLGERPSRLQGLGLLLYLVGALVYFLPVTVPLSVYGLVVVLIGLLANVAGSMLGRSVNRERRLHPALVTLVSMGIGSVALLVTGVSVDGLPSLDRSDWAIVVWLAVVNTALAFTLWNHTLQRLSAMESSVINNTMLIQIAILAWLFLDEPLGAKEMAGILLAAVGVLLVQLRADRPGQAGP